MTDSQQTQFEQYIEIGRLRGRVDALSEDVAEHKRETDQRIRDVDQRITSHLDVIEKKLDSISARVNRQSGARTILLAIGGAILSAVGFLIAKTPSFLNDVIKSINNGIKY